jgi:hypothetical protein
VPFGRVLWCFQVSGDVMKLDDLYMDFVNGAARLLFVDAWARREEEKAERTGKKLNWSQKNLMDLAPATPRCCFLEAARLMGELEAANGNIYSIVEAAARADGVSQIDVADFGHYVASQALGAGTSWFDDHAKFPLKIPRFALYAQF